MENPHKEALNFNSFNLPSFYEKLLGGFYCHQFGKSELFTRSRACHNKRFIGAITRIILVAFIHSSFCLLAFLLSSPLSLGFSLPFPLWGTLTSKKTFLLREQFSDIAHFCLHCYFAFPCTSTGTADTCSFPPSEVTVYVYFYYSLTYSCSVSFISLAASSRDQYI